MLFPFQFVNDVSQALLAKWEARKKPKCVLQKKKTKKFVLDPVHMHGITSCIQSVWMELAGEFMLLAQFSRSYHILVWLLL